MGRLAKPADLGRLKGSDTSAITGFEQLLADFGRAGACVPDNLFCIDDMPALAECGRPGSIDPLGDTGPEPGPGVERADQGRDPHPVEGDAVKLRAAPAMMGELTAVERCDRGVEKEER